MATPRDIRVLAFQALFELDARGDEDADAVRAAMSGDREGLSGEVKEKDLDKAFGLALAAFRDRRAADDEVLRLAPGWPANRQPAVDRAVLRLAHYEITSGRVAPKIAVNEAVEIAKKFGGEKTPAFVNGVLDKVLKKTLSAAHGAGAEGGG